MTETVTFELQPSDDKELTCVFCYLQHCDREIMAYGPGRRVWCGAHEKCVKLHMHRVQRKLRRDK